MSTCHEHCTSGRAAKLQLEMYAVKADEGALMRIMTKVILKNKIGHKTLQKGKEKGLGTPRMHMYVHTHKQNKHC